MVRKGILDTSKAIFDLLKNEKELSTKKISEKIKVDWRTTKKSLDFLIYVGVVKERKGFKSYKEERLFSSIKK
jgi:Mn-dependent DtxR family transcriptional regulator